jgi:hypothetical protein
VGCFEEERMMTSIEAATRSHFLKMVYDAGRRKAHGTQTRDDEALLWAADKLQRLKAELGDAGDQLATKSSDKS